jgi:hypothetical protein
MLARKEPIPTEVWQDDLKTSEKTFESGSDDFLDFIASHELGHVLCIQHGIDPSCNWLNEYRSHPAPGRACRTLFPVPQTSRLRCPTWRPSDRSRFSQAVAGAEGDQAPPPPAAPHTLPGGAAGIRPLTPDGVEELLLNLLLVQSFGQGPSQARGLGPHQVIADGAGGQTTTAGDRAHRQPVFVFESEDFFDVTHGFRFSCH